MKKMIVLSLCVLTIPLALQAAAGDVNSDGRIDIVDALLIAQYYVGLNPANFTASASDVNCSGSTDVVDALLVAQLYVGLVSALPGCVQTPVPTAIPTATPVASGPFASRPVGFASMNADGQNGTTGGEGGQTVTVRTQADLEAYAGASAPYVIRVEGTITISPFGKEVAVASNKTIVGVGANATISQGGFVLDPANNVIIRNLTIRDSFVEGDYDGKTQDYDGIQVDNSHHIWIDHCRITHMGDGIIDLREATTYVTVSWCILDNHNKCFGLGWTDNTEYKVTIHHVWIHDTNQRNPSFDNGIGHLYNNFLENVTSYGNYSRGAARLVIENSYFQGVNDPYYPDSTAQLVARGNRIVSCTGRSETLGSAFNPSSYYSYTLDPVDDVPNILRTYAGPNANIQY